MDLAIEVAVSMTATATENISDKSNCIKTKTLEHSITHITPKTTTPIRGLDNSHHAA